MSMSQGGSEGLFKLAENAAPEEDRIMPPDRKYLKSSATVSLTDAISLLKCRRKDPTARIVGGLDDNSRKVLKEAKKKKLQKTEKTVEKTSADFRQDVLDLRDQHARHARHARHDRNDVNDAQDAQDAQDDTPETEPKERDRKTRVTLSDVLNGMSLLNDRIDALGKELHDSKPKDEDKPGGNEDPAEDGPDPRYVLDSFKSGNHKVTFLVNGMAFTVRCLNLVKDDDSHCLVLAFPEDGDSFFEPPMQSELEIRYDGKSVGGKLFYFGMCFVLKQLGLRFLGFLFDEISNATKEG